MESNDRFDRLERMLSVALEQISKLQTEQEWLDKSQLGTHLNVHEDTAEKMVYKAGLKPHRKQYVNQLSWVWKRSEVNAKLIVPPEKMAWTVNLKDFKNPKVMSSAVFTGTKLDSFTLELPFQEGLINESHPLWLDGFSFRADSNNKECGSRKRNMFSSKHLDICYAPSRGFGAGTKKIRMIIKAKLLGELYLQGVNKATLPVLVDEINAIGGGNLFSFTVDHLLNSTYTDADITRDRHLPSTITMKEAFDLMISMLKQSTAKPPSNKNDIRIIKSHIERHHVQEHYELPFLMIYDKSLEMGHHDVQPLIRMETNIRNWKHTYHITGMKIKLFGDFLEVLEDEDIMSEFFNKAIGSWFISRLIKAEEAPQYNYSIRLLYKAAKADACKKQKQVFDIISSVVKAECFDVSERQRRDIKNKVKSYAEYLQQPKPNFVTKFNELEAIGFLPEPRLV